jgi:hypothetical protein
MSYIPTPAGAILFVILGPIPLLVVWLVSLFDGSVVLSNAEKKKLNQMRDEIQSLSRSENESEQSFVLRKDILRLIYNCHEKRVFLIASAQQRTSRLKLLSFVAGFLSLLSTASIAALLVKWLPIDQAAYVGLLTLCSGVVSLFAATSVSSSDLTSKYRGAAEFHHLREQANLLRLELALSTRNKLDSYRKLLEEYTRIDSMYQSYVPDVR